jgi:EAL domain-containing protein (putative c-di-GMP-specific phosphodiesterase class I)
VPPTISVNFSRRNLSNAHLAADIDEVVQQYHVPKKMIEIEITETIDEFPISVLKGFVDDLHKLGYKVAVDDFGSGSSSLSLLREVTFDTLKIDKGFVDKSYAKDLAILSYMIKLAKAIGAETLAEGVEQREQVDTLLSLGCEIIQGYYFDRPLSKDVFERRIINRRYKIEQS